MHVSGNARESSVVFTNEAKHIVQDRALEIRVLKIYGDPHVILARRRSESVLLCSECLKLGRDALGVNYDRALTLLAHLLDVPARYVPMNRHPGMGVVQVCFEHSALSFRHRMSDCKALTESAPHSASCCIAGFLEAYSALTMSDGRKFGDVLTGVVEDLIFPVFFVSAACHVVALL